MERHMQTRTRRSFLGVGVLTSLAACARPFGVSLARSEPITKLRRVVTGRNRAGKAIAVDIRRHVVGQPTDVARREHGDDVRLLQ